MTIHEPCRHPHIHEPCTSSAHVTHSDAKAELFRQQTRADEEKDGGGGGGGVNEVDAERDRVTPERRRRQD